MKERKLQNGAHEEPAGHIGLFSCPSFTCLDRKMGDHASHQITE
jgi:hypothetical protein